MSSSWMLYVVCTMESLALRVLLLRELSLSVIHYITSRAQLVRSRSSGKLIRTLSHQDVVQCTGAS